MHVLVTDTSRHGTTDELAERIAARLRDRGLTVTHLGIAAVDDVEAYDAVVVGAGTSGRHWRRPARRFVQQHEEELARRPVWLFSSEFAPGDGRPQEFDEFHAVVEAEDEVVLTADSDPRAIEDWVDGIARRLADLRRDRAIDAVHQMP